MCRSKPRRFGTRALLPVASALILVLIFRNDSFAQQNFDTNILQMPQVVKFTAPPATTIAPAPQAPPAGLIQIPVTVIDAAGRCVASLSARDFSLSVDGEESPIAWFRPNRATSAALGVLVDISQGMEFKSFSGRTLSQLPFIRSAIQTLLDKLDAHDNVFLATFARRFHMLDDFTSDRRDLEQRLPMVRVTDQLDDFDANGIYESILKGITVLAHAPKACDRRALLVFTNAYCDTSTHGADDVIAKAQFAGVTVSDVIVPGFFHRTDMFSAATEMQRIAAETGGLTIIVKDTGDQDFSASSTDEIVSELDNQYVLGFSVSPWGSNAVPVELMLPHYPGMRVRAPHVVRFRRDDLLQQLAAPASQTLPE
jgi:VWFA-related protein